MNDLWEKAYENANEFMRIGLNMMKEAGYTVDYNETTKEFKFIPPKKEVEK